MTELIAQCKRARGRNIKRDVVVRLVGAAGGFCERPSCPTGSLWHELPSGGDAVKLAEVAHIVAASDDGPRGDGEVATSELVAFQNLILLCPNCHTIVDRAPEEYSVAVLNGWKVAHERRLRELLSIRVFDTRAGARMELQRVLAQNRSVWERYGPESEAGATPEGSATWLRQVQCLILPNNTRLSALFEANARLLRAEEHQVVSAFDTHRRGLEDRHLGVDVGVAAPRYPSEVENLFID
ncbi:HNH endonuclease [Tessaracoccus sp. G1721]